MTKERSLAELKRIAANQQEIMARQVKDLQHKEETIKMGEAMLEQRASELRAAQNDVDYRTAEQAMDFAIRATPLPWLMAATRIKKAALKMLGIREDLRKRIQDTRATMEAIQKTLDEVTAINKEMKELVDAYQGRKDEVVNENNHEHHVEQDVQA